MGNLKLFPKCYNQTKSSLSIKNDFNFYLFTWKAVCDILLSGEKRLSKQSGLIFILYLFLYA